MSMRNAVAKLRQHRAGFSILELSIVITIISIMATMGLEMAAAFLSNTAYQNTQTTLSTIDAALVKYRNVYGRLPCPASLTSSIIDMAGASYSKEACPGTTLPGGIAYVNVTNGGAGYTEQVANSGTFTVTFTDASNAYASSASGTAYIDSNGTVQYITIDNPGYGFNAGDTVTLNASNGGGGTGLNTSVTISTISVGAVPVRDLGLPLADALDGFGGKILYYVTTGQTSSATFGVDEGVIQIRSGPLTEPCTAAPCSITSYGAAYVLVSTGKDQRGAYSKLGALKNDCYFSANYNSGTYSTIDTQNCAFEGTTTGLTLTPGQPSGVIYNSPFNNGIFGINYTDDIIVSRMKTDL